MRAGAGLRDPAGGQIVLRQGWRPAAVGVVVAAVTTAIVIGSATELVWITSRAAVVGLLLYTVGLAFGSQRLVGLASAPLLVSALSSVDPASGSAGGRALIVGCCWYVSLELAWASIDQRPEGLTKPAVGRRRMQEVAAVVIISVVVGVGGIVLTTFAPDRTLVVRGLVIGSALTAMIIAIRQLSATAPPPPDR